MLEELKTFLKVVEYNSFTKAAQKINLSQPTVSVHIKRLEEYFNTTLIYRSSKTREIQITEKGEILCERAVVLMESIEDIKKEISDKNSKKSETLKVGASLTIGEHILPKILKEFIGEIKNVELEIVIENSASICSKIIHNELDIGLIESDKTDIINKFKFLNNDKMIIVSSPNSSLLNEKITLKDLDNQIWISREQGSGTREFLLDFLSEYKLTPKKIISFSTNFAVKEAVKNDMGITLISGYVVEHSIFDKELGIVRLDLNLNRSYSYIIPQNKKYTKALTMFIDKLDRIEIK